MAGVFDGDAIGVAAAGVVTVVVSVVVGGAGVVVAAGICNADVGVLEASPIAD